LSERLVPVPRRAKTWQPNPALLLVSTARAFAAAHWDEVRDEVRDEARDDIHDELHADIDALHDDALLDEAFAEATPKRSFTQGGLQLGRDDFRPLQIRPFTQPLSELSRQALQRFNAELAAENPIVDASAEPSAQQDALMLDANAQAARTFKTHPLLARAPFLPDVYELDDAPLPGDTDADLSADEASEAMAFEAEPGDALATDELHADAAVHADDVANADDVAHAEAALQDEASPGEAHATDAASDATDPLAADEQGEEHSADEHSTDEHAHAQQASGEAAHADSDAQALDGDANADPSLALDGQNNPALDELAADPQDADPHAANPQTEATDGMPAQSASDIDLSEADLTDEGAMAPQDIADAEEEAVDAAVDAALQASAEAQAVPGIDAEEMARREAEHYQQGYAEGERVAREAMAQEIAAQRTVLEGVTQQLHALLQDPQQFFEPLKRLAVHVAEQVVLQELQTSPRILEQLIERCLDALDHPAQGMVTVELHPQDKARLIEAAPDLIQGMRLDTSDDLHVGSVRLFANDTVVEDLVEKRMHALVRGLQVNASAWQAHSALLHAPNATEHDSQPADSSESDDVHS
jgi:flagellar biosynthesis/type III secretory pathway protein FliH